jgi:hypothetical protein
MQSLRVQSDYHDMKFRILSISRHNQYKDYISNTQNGCIKKCFSTILQNSKELTDCTINTDTSTVFKMNNGDEVTYKIDSGVYNKIRNIFKKHLMKRPNMDLMIIKDRIAHLQQLCQENLGNSNS